MRLVLEALLRTELSSSMTLILHVLQNEIFEFEKKRDLNSEIDKKWD